MITTRVYRLDDAGLILRRKHPTVRVRLKLRTSHSPFNASALLRAQPKPRQARSRALLSSPGLGPLLGLPKDRLGVHFGWLASRVLPICGLTGQTYNQQHSYSVSVCSSFFWTGSPHSTTDSTLPAVAQHVSRYHGTDEYGLHVQSSSTDPRCCTLPS